MGVEKKEVSRETKSLQSVSHLGIKPSQETKERMSTSHLKIKPSQEIRQLMSFSHLVPQEWQKWYDICYKRCLEFEYTSEEAKIYSLESVKNQKLFADDIRHKLGFRILEEDKNLVCDNVIKRHQIEPDPFVLSASIWRKLQWCEQNKLKEFPEESNPPYRLTDEEYLYLKEEGVI